MEQNKKTILTLGAVLILVFSLVFIGISLTRNLGKSDTTVDRETAVAKLDKYVKKIGAKEGMPSKGAVSYTEEDTTYQELPELNEESIAVYPNTDMYAEIFASSEKTGNGADGYLREMAEQFNRSDATLSDGTKVSIMLRTVASGQQVDYVSSGKYIPDAICPSSTMQVRMINAKGVETEYIKESMVMNYAGMVINSKTYSTLLEDYGEANISTLAKATEDGVIVMGYTNPFTSATGLNFLVTLLDNEDKGNILSDTATKGFQAFQKNIPFVAMTTGQMRNAADKGTFDAFVSEYQTYSNDANLTKNYKFIPFGYEHENPLAVIEDVSKEKKEILTLFAKYCDENGEVFAKECGFNTKPDGYSYMSTEYSGQELISAQKLYKENKDSQPIICVFVTDVSGSMDGEPLNTLKESLINSMQYINEENYIGIVSYGSEVTIELPIAQFDLTQQSYFKGTVEQLTANGKTATCNGICVALDMMNQQLKETPDAKCILFVLSDGVQNIGYSLNDITPIVSGMQVPIYTICYNNGDTGAMKALSEINEGASINASTEDVTYQLKQLFNANM